MKNRLKRQRNEELRQMYFALVDPIREGGPMKRKDALEKILEYASEKYFITSERTLEQIVFKYGHYAQQHHKQVTRGTVFARGNEIEAVREANS